MGFLVNIRTIYIMKKCDKSLIQKHFYFFNLKNGFVRVTHFYVTVNPNQHKTSTYVQWGPKEKQQNTPTHTHSDEINQVKNMYNRPQYMNTMSRYEICNAGVISNMYVKTNKRCCKSKKCFR